jgi:hypothetical protein
MAERMSRLFPPTLVGADGTQATTEPLLFISVEEGMEHRTGGAAVVLARLVPRHAAGQGIDRYATCEGGFQEVDRGWVPSLGGAACLDRLDIWRVVDCRAGRLAEADPSVRVHRHYPASHCTVCWLRRWIGVCRWAVCVYMVDGEGRARPKVSLVLNDGGVVSVVLTCARVQPPWLPRLGCRALEPVDRRSAEWAARWGTTDGGLARAVGRGDRVCASSVQRRMAQGWVARDDEGEEMAVRGLDRHAGRGKDSECFAAEKLAGGTGESRRTGLE